MDGKVKKCPDCGVAMKMGAKACPACGKELPGESPFCPSHRDQDYVVPTLERLSRRRQLP